MLITKPAGVLVTSKEAEDTGGNSAALADKAAKAAARKARAAGIPVIAVDYGYTETPVDELGPDRVISALSELPAAVFDLLPTGKPVRAEPG